MKITNFFIFISFLISATLSEKKLLLVYHHFRHGSREIDAKTDSEGRDKFGFKWPVSRGQLTGVGMRQHYLIGVRNRNRYIKKFKLLSEPCDLREIKIQSSDTDRTLVSVYSQLQGLFPQSTGPLLTESQKKFAVPNITLTQEILDVINKLGDKALPSQITPVPVHEMHKNKHFFNLQSKDRCPGITKYRKNNLDNDLIRKTANEFYNKYADKLYKALDKGKPISEKDKYKRFPYLVDLAEDYISAYQYGHKFENLQEVGIDIKEIFDEFFHIFMLQVEIGAFGDKDKFVAKVSSSPMLGDLLFYFKKKVDEDIEGTGKIGFNSYNKPKYMIFSGHDTTLAALEIFMQKYLHTGPFIPVTLAASMYLELYKNEDAPETGGTYSDYTVEYYFNDNKIKEWPFAEFYRKIADNIFTKEEIEEICNFDNFDDGSSTKNKYVAASWSLGGISVAIIIVTIILSIVMVKKKGNVISSENLIPEENSA